MIFRGTPLGFTEAPHLYKRGGYYYLLTAEGGTGWGHAVTMARSRDAAAAVRAASRHVHPHRAPSSRCRAAARRPCRPGRDAEGETYMVYLCGRPLRNRGRCTLGRETAIQTMVWARRRLAAHARTGEGLPRLEVPAPELPRAPVPARSRRARISTPAAADRLPVAAHAAAEELFSLTARPGHLRLFGRETIGSLFRQSLVARRQQSLCFSAVHHAGFRAASTSSRWRAWSATTAAPNSTTCMCRTTSRSASTCA